jgi:uncharacterized protein YlxW (UPF0749 family)
MGMNHLMIRVEEYKKENMAYKEENRLLRHDVQELQDQVYTLYKRIAELTTEGNHKY